MKKPLSSEDVYKDILRKIINLELEPGTKISENKIAEEYGVSRSIVRSAFIRLSQNNFLVIFPQRGTYIKLISKEYIKTALIIRLAIEKEILFRLMKKEDLSSIICELEIIVKEQERFYNTNEYVEEFKILDEKFHNCIALGIDNKSILCLMKDHLMHINRWRNTNAKSDYNVSEIIDEHKKILACIKEKDYIKAFESMTDHIETLFDIVSNNLEYSEYFSE